MHTPNGKLNLYTLLQNLQIANLHTYQNLPCYKTFKSQSVAKLDVVKLQIAKFHIQQQPTQKWKFFHLTHFENLKITNSITMDTTTHTKFRWPQLGCKNVFHALLNCFLRFQCCLLHVNSCVATLITKPPSNLNL